MVDCGVTCAKYSVFFFNLLFAVSCFLFYLYDLSYLLISTKFKIENYIYIVHILFEIFNKQLTGIAILTVGTVIFTAFNHYQNFLGK